MCFTAALFVVALGQVVLFWYQLRIMWRGLEDSTTAAKAAKLSALAAVREVRGSERRQKVLERAYIGGGGARRSVQQYFHPSSGIPGYLKSVPAEEFEIHIANQGRAAAIFDLLNTDIAISGNSRLAPRIICREYILKIWLGRAQGIK